MFEGTAGDRSTIGAHGYAEHDVSRGRKRVVRQWSTLNVAPEDATVDGPADDAVAIRTDRKPEHVLAVDGLPDRRPGPGVPSEDLAPAIERRIRGERLPVGERFRRDETAAVTGEGYDVDGPATSDQTGTCVPNDHGSVRAPRHEVASGRVEGEGVHVI